MLKNPTKTKMLGLRRRWRRRAIRNSVRVNARRVPIADLVNLASRVNLAADAVLPTGIADRAKATADLVKIVQWNAALASTTVRAKATVVLAITIVLRPVAAATAIMIARRNASVANAISASAIVIT